MSKLVKRFQESKVNSGLALKNISITDDEQSLMDDYLFSGTEIVPYEGFKPKGIVANKVIGAFVGAIIGLALFPVLGPLGFQLGIVIGGLIGSLFERKKKPKEDPKFKQEASFNTDLTVARYGDPIAMIFCNKDANEYGGVRVRGNLINARVTNVLGEEYVKMLFVIGLGELGSETEDPYDLTGLQFEDTKIDLATNSDVTVRTTRGIPLQDSFNDEFPYASQVKIPQQNKSCSSKFILELPKDSTGGGSFPSDYTLDWVNVPVTAVTPVSDILGNGFPNQLFEYEYYKIVSVADEGIIQANFDLPSGTGSCQMAAIYKQDTSFGADNLGGQDYTIEFYELATVPKARLVRGGVTNLFDVAVNNKEFFFRFINDGVQSRPAVTIEVGYRDSIGVSDSREEILYTNLLTVFDYEIHGIFDYSQNPLILTAMNATPIDWVIGARGGNISSGSGFTRINLNKELIGAISYGIDYAMYQEREDIESPWFRFTEINTEEFWGLTDSTINFPKSSYLYAMSQFEYETTKPCDIVEINMFGVIWSRKKKDNKLVDGIQIFDVYVNIDPSAGYTKIQRFFISSNNTSGIKRQIRLIFNNKNYRSIKIRPILSLRGGESIRKISPNNNESVITDTQGAYTVETRFQEDEITLSNVVPDDPFNPRPIDTPAPTWIYSYFEPIRDATDYIHSSDSADPLVINSVNEAAYYPQNFDGTYPDYAMYSVIAKVTPRTNPLNPSIVVTRGIRGRVLTAVTTISTKESNIFPLSRCVDFDSSDIVYCPRLDLVITPDELNFDTVTIPQSLLTSSLSVGDVILVFSYGNISRWPDVFNHGLTNSKYLGDIVSQLMVDYYSLIESKLFANPRQYFYDFAQIESVSFQQWALANSAFNLMLPKKSGGKYGLMPIVRTDIKDMFSNYNILIDSYNESSVPYKDTDIDNLGVKTIDGRDNRYKEKQVGVIRNTNFNYSFVIDAQSITREQQGKDFAVYSMNSRVKQDEVVEFSTDWEGANVGVGELIYVLREENLYANECSGIITEVDTINNTVTLSTLKESANKLLIFTQNTRQFFEYTLVTFVDDVATLDDVAPISVGDTFILGGANLVKHRYITQNKSLDIEQNSCRLTGVVYPDDLESTEGLTIYSDYFNPVTLP